MAYVGSGSGLKMLLEAIRSILTEYQPVISILDPFQANALNVMSPNFPRFSKNLHNLTPGGSGRPTTIFLGIIVGRKWSKSFIDFTRFPTPRPQIFMASPVRVFPGNSLTGKA